MEFAARSDDISCYALQISLGKKAFGRPVGLHFRPVGLRFRPVGLRFRPVGLLDHRVFGLRSSILE